MLRICLLVLATQCLFATAEEGAMLPNYAEVERKCRDEFQLSEETIASLNNSKYVETDDQKIKCFVKCMHMGFKVMNEMGDIELEKEREQDIKNPKALAAFERCKDVNGTDPCDKAVNLQNCFTREMAAEENKPPE